MQMRFEQMERLEDGVLEGGEVEGGFGPEVVLPQNLLEDGEVEGFLVLLKKSSLKKVLLAQKPHYIIS